MTDDDLRAEVRRLREEVDALRRRLDAVESAVDGDPDAATDPPASADEPPGGRQGFVRWGRIAAGAGLAVAYFSVYAAYGSRPTATPSGRRCGPCSRRSRCSSPSRPHCRSVTARRWLPARRSCSATSPLS